MLASGPVLVHVVNSGTDWLALAAVISTGVVGIAGIGGTIWVSSRGWARDEQRARIAEKRRIYAACLTALGECQAARTHVDSADDRDAARYTFNLSFVAANSAVHSVVLIAPERLGVLATILLSYVANPSGHRTSIGPRRNELIAEMRADLGEPPLGDVLTFDPLATEVAPSASRPSGCDPGSEQ